MDFWKELIFNEEGQGMAEYVFILALIAVAAIFAFDFFGSKTSSLIDSVASNIP
jgi:Flp pilus assembly pilin Flp